MSSATDNHDRDHLELACLYALHALPAAEAAAAEAHLSTCATCRQEVETMRPIIESFVSWPTDVLRPSPSVWDRLANRIIAETRQGEPVPVPPSQEVSEWEAPAPGISVQLLASDTENDRVSMLVRLAPGAAYPPHRHNGVEELYLLDGELWIDDKKLYPGDYNRGEPGASDQRVWSETGCTCVLLTSSRDLLL